MIDLPACACGRITDGVQTECWPCQSDNTRGGFYCPTEERGPIYGASLASHAPVPGDALRAVEAVWITPATSAPCRRCALVAAENSDLARQVVTLQGRLYEAQCALKRTEKGSGDVGLAR